MKTVSVRLDSDLQYIEVDTLADLHIGAKECNFAEIKQRVNEIKDNPNRYCILNGDLIDNATKTSLGDVFQSSSPMEQMNTAINLFEPIKDKILCVTGGNHEARSYKNDGIDLTYFLCRQLNITQRYSSEAVVLFLRFGTLNRHKAKGRQALYTMYIKHGRGGGKRPGAKANRLEDMMRTVNTDIYIHSHTHSPMVLMFTSFDIDPQNDSVTERERLAINTGASLEFGGYGEVAEYSPTSRRTPLIILSGTKKEYKAII